MDIERKSRNQQALKAAGLTAVVCALPANVLLMSGYWPVVGSSIAISVCGGPTVLLIPEDESEVAATSFADLVKTFVPETVTEMSSISAAVKPQLNGMLHKLNINYGRIGVETGASSQPASYLSLHLYGDQLRSIAQASLPSATLVPIDEWIRTLRSVKTAFELEKVRLACAVAKIAFEIGASKLSAGMNEREAALCFRAPLSNSVMADDSVQRNDGFAFCMSGRNSAKAYAAYARTRQRTLETSDFVMMHCNSYVDGYWTDLTRTYTLQPPDKQQSNLYSAVFEARKAALSTIKPGVRAAVVDAAARHAIQDCWLGHSIKHGTGHGVGLSAMSSYSIPRIHCYSPDVLEQGMVFNVEPAVYIENYGGVRHCDMVAVTEAGYELLTDFQSDRKSLTVPNRNLISEQQIQSGNAV